ncbi:response regulator [Sphingobacterium siyangense]|uniref:response regulator n=1 Tax=Sphingobacterium siyangense TaxID=459529 RepID=UPI003DA26993
MVLYIYNSKSNGAKPLFDSLVKDYVFFKDRVRNFDVSVFFESVANEDYLYLNNRDEFYLNKISTSICSNELSGVKIIIVESDLGGDGLSRSVNLVYHIVFTASHRSIRFVIVDPKYTLPYSHVEDTVIKRPIDGRLVRLMSHEEICKVEDDALIGDKIPFLERLINMDTYNHSAPIEIDQSKVHDERHLSANQWGVYRLAYNFGCLDKINIKLPQNLYFKFLQSTVESAPSKDFDDSLHGKFNKILLIDDNGSNGWERLIGAIHSCSVELLSDCQIAVSKSRDLSFIGQFDLVYLDLYLNRNEANSKIESLTILSEIKKSRPDIPVIIFTASEKAINMRAVLEKGADAVYIKESPRYYWDDTISFKNYRFFKKTIEDVYKKYKVLRPYWLGISGILSSSVFQNIDNNPCKYKARIEERLKMFFGLLKKGFEQTDYDKEVFFYSDYEIAFMTLWSILNDIQEAFFEKSDIEYVCQNNIKYSFHPSGDKICKHKRWELRYYSQGILLNNLGEFDSYDNLGNPLIDNNRYKMKNTKSKSPLYYDTNIAPHYFIEGNNPPSAKHTGKDCLQKISLSIAFIILKMPSHSTTHLTSLNKLNAIRNSLYLTHGNEDFVDYYKLLEQDKRSSSDYSINPEQDIKELFELVNFILTGDANEVIIFS